MKLEQSEFQQGNKKMMGGKTVSSRSVVGKTGCQHVQEWECFLISHPAQLSSLHGSKIFIILKSMKLLEERTGCIL